MPNKKILVVDDDRDFAESIAMRCRGRGWDAEAACSPLAAVESMTSHPPDLFCLDVNMPTGNGLDLCEYLVRDTSGIQTPVIILTGQMDLETVRRAKRLQTRYICKSTDIWQRLRPEMEELLDERLLDDETRLLATTTSGVDCCYD
jgi:CheY-like chemotaxis protein